MSVLDKIIDGASDPSVRVADLLRQTMVAAHRVKADSVRQWARRELAGYNGVPDEELPVFRQPQPALVQATWSGPFQSSTKTVLTIVDAPDGFFKQFFELDFRQSVSELESFALDSEGHDEVSRPWPAFAVGTWNQYIADGKAVSVGEMGLLAAHTRIPKPLLVGVLDAVRTEVLNLALELQSVDDTAGEAGGPTVAEDSEVAAVITQFHTNIYGDNATIAQGGHVEQTVTVVAGDVGTLTQAARSVGLEGAALTEYIEAALAAKSDPEQSKLRAFADKVRGGAVALSGNVAGNVAASHLMTWAGAFLG